MFDGFVRAAVGTPRIRVGDCEGNARAIVDLMKEAAAEGAKLITLPEMCVTGCTAGDLLLSEALLRGARRAVESIAAASAGCDALTCFGAPVEVGGALYNCAVFVCGGKILAAVPKRGLSNRGADCEGRYFAPGPARAERAAICGQDALFGGDVLICCEQMPQLVVGAEVGGESALPEPPGARLALAGATVLMNPSGACEIAGGADFGRMLARAHSARLLAACLLANAGEGESSTDMVFSGRNGIVEGGEILAESQPYTTGLRYADIDVSRLARERRRAGVFGGRSEGFARAPFSLRMERLSLRRAVDPAPFVPADPAARAARCGEILAIQSHGLATRMRHIGAKKAVLAVSGGLDSTLALLVTARAFDLMGLARSGIVAITMPCFGTTGRTRSNAQILSERLGTEFREIRIEEAVRRHFQDIGLREDARDVTYENSQARERTQVLMDVANQCGGIAVGTGDLSELALGWATYNGDHMSMYGVNASVPKTLVRHLVEYEAERSADAEIARALRDVLATPVSPELLPPVDGEIAQRTEDLVGPYELHDFFLYHILRRGETAEKTARLAEIAFAERYPAGVIRAWLKVFARRFFSQQFKRSCMPDGPKVGSVSLSPRGDLRMPSDACGALWQSVE